MRKQHNVRNVRRTASETWSDPKAIPSSAHRKLVLCLCKEANTPFSLALTICVRENDWLTAIDVSKSLNPNHYGKDHISYSSDAQCAALVKKYAGLPIDIDTRSACAKKFIEAELSCRKTNEYFRNGSFFAANNNAQIFKRAQVIIAEILGDHELVDLTQVAFSTGRTFSIKENISAFDKLNGPLEVTYKAQNLAKSLLKANPGWLQPFSQRLLPPYDEPELVLSPGDLYSSVSKDATTDRPLGIPPLLNSIMSKSVGKHISRRYRKVAGVNINTAQRKHANVVEQASIDGNIASIDLASASDTISHRLVMDLLPYGWFKLLNDLRSPSFYLKENETWYSYEKFTAMGCAFTFELESVIFYSLCKATMDINGISGFLSVYGDDILLPTTAYQAVTSFLGECGFETNHTKSFGIGYFRESCGADFLNGNTVRPFFLKDQITPRVLVLMHNTMVRSGTRYKYPRTFCLLRQLIPRCFFETISGPLGSDGDDYLIDEEIVEGLSYRTIQTVMQYRRVSVNDPGLLAYFMYRIEQCGHGSLNPVLKDVLDSTTPMREIRNEDSGEVEFYEFPTTDASETTSFATDDRNKRPDVAHYFRVSSLKQDLQCKELQPRKSGI